MKPRIFIHQTHRDKTPTRQMPDILCLLGWTNTICFVACAVCSYGLATVISDRGLLREKFSDFGGAFGSIMQAFMSGESFAKT